MAQEKALIAMSGGVDSSVAAYLTMAGGFDCIGATMRLYEAQNDEPESTCCADELMFATVQPVFAQSSES